MSDSLPFLVVILVAVLFLWQKRQTSLLWRRMFEAQRTIQQLDRSLMRLRRNVVLQNIGETRLPCLAPAQGGEDIVVLEFFGGRRGGFFVDVGAYDGVGFSNTYLLEAIGWDGVCIEPTPSAFEKCRASRPFSRVVQAAAVGPGEGPTVVLRQATGARGIDTLNFIGESSSQRTRVLREGGALTSLDVPALTLDQILGDFSGCVDLVSIDVEGCELGVLQGLDIARFQPALFVIEDNSGGRDTRVPRYLESFGYAERFRMDHNVFYARTEDRRTIG